MVAKKAYRIHEEHMKKAAIRKDFFSCIRNIIIFAIIIKIIITMIIKDDGKDSQQKTFPANPFGFAGNVSMFFMLNLSAKRRIVPV